MFIKASFLSSFLKTCASRFGLSDIDTTLVSLFSSVVSESRVEYEYDMRNMRTRRDFIHYHIISMLYSSNAMLISVIKSLWSHRDVLICTAERCTIYQTDFQSFGVLVVLVQSFVSNMGPKSPAGVHLG